MSYELNRSAVITGCVNCFCLACETFLQNREEAAGHIITASHCENLSAIPYSDKFNDHYIRKFRAGYYCMFCNELMHTAVHVNLHVCEDRHENNRGIHLLKYSKNEIIAFNKVLINENSWHGLMNKVCCICDAEFEDETLHKTETSHVLKLIQKPIKFGVNDTIYRQIDDRIIQCLTCNILLSTETKHAHFDDSNHHKLIQPRTDETVESKETKDTLDNDDGKDMTSTAVLYNPDTKKPKDNKSDIIEHETSKIMENIFMYMSNDIDINYETEMAYCRKCSAEINFNHNDIKQHIIEDLKSKNSTVDQIRYPVNVDKNKYSTSQNTEEPIESRNKDQDENETQTLFLMEHSDPDHDAKFDDSCTFEIASTSHEMNGHRINNPTVIDAHQFAKDNNITYNSNNNNSFCRLCQVRLPSSVRSMQEHVEGVSHKRNLQAATAKPKVDKVKKKKTVAKFVHSVTLVRSPFCSGFLINGDYLIDESSFWLLQSDTLDENYICLLCRKTVSKFSWTIARHIKECSGPSGKKLCIITDSDEFIREIGPESYHCGFCHTVVSGWTDMENHLLSAEHGQEKFKCRIRHGVVTGQLPLHFLLLADDD